MEEVVAVDGLQLSLLRPRSAEALLDEEAFEREEFLPYWAELWPSSLALARVVARRSVAGRRVLELGCGLALPSLVCALHGARVLATDWAPDAIALLDENASRNDVELETALVSWGDAGELASRGPWDLVLASDVLYERRNGPLLAELLPRLVDRGEILVADPGRPHAGPFLADAREAWDVESRLDPGGANVSLHRLRRPRPSGSA